MQLFFLVSGDFKKGTDIDRIPPKVKEETVKKRPSVRSENPTVPENTRGTLISSNLKSMQTFLSAKT
jgi:hypothetical protein